MDQLSLKSIAFGNNQIMPKLYTCEGENISPPLEWKHAPEGTKSLTLVVEDPDAPDPAAPKHTFTHWIVYNIAPWETGLEEGAPNLSEQTKFGKNDYDHTAWDGPCPPIGKHRYFYKLFALDSKLEFTEAPSRLQIEDAMKGHILGQAELIGLYQKTGQTA